jgi:hypothetical protein
VPLSHEVQIDWDDFEEKTRECNEQWEREHQALMQKEKERLDRIEKNFRELDDIIARAVVEDDDDKRGDQWVEAYSPIVTLVSEINLAGLKLWNDKGLAGTIGGGVVVEGCLLIWFKSGEAPDTEFLMTMTHSWLRKPRSRIMVDDDVDTLLATAEALKWAMKKNGLQHYPENEKAADLPPHFYKDDDSLRF